MSFEEWFENWWLEHERDVLAPTPKEALRQAWLAGRKAEKASQHRVEQTAKPCIGCGSTLVGYCRSGCTAH